MSAAPEADLPPSYGDSNSAAAATTAAAPAASAPETLPPATLYVAGRFVHSSNPQAPPLYELSHSVGFLRGSDHTVTVERLDHSVKTAADGTPKVSTRKRHIFDLKHPTMLVQPVFQYHAEATSRQSMCSFGLITFRPPGKKLSLSPKGYRVHRATTGEDRVVMAKEEILTAVPGRDAAVAYEWKDAEGKLIAREIETDDLMSMVVGVEMSAALRDLLVSAWITRIWYDLAKGKHREKKWDYTKRVMHHNKRDFAPSNGPFF